MTIINITVSLGELKLFCIVRFTVCWNRNKSTASWNLSPWPGLWQVNTHYGIPRRQMGATTAPRTAQWSSQAACLALGAAYHNHSYTTYKGCIKFLINPPPQIK